MLVRIASSTVVFLLLHDMFLVDKYRKWSQSRNPEIFCGTTMTAEGPGCLPGGWHCDETGNAGSTASCSILTSEISCQIESQAYCAQNEMSTSPLRF